LQDFTRSDLSWRTLERVITRRWSTDENSALVAEENTWSMGAPRKYSLATDPVNEEPIIDTDTRL
jgi:hypothetical protein